MKKTDKVIVISAKVRIFTSLIKHDYYENFFSIINTIIRSKSEAARL